MDAVKSEFVLIGLVDEDISEVIDYNLDWRVNKIGGMVKISPSLNYDWDQIKSHLKCTLCNDLTLFIGQIYCPIDSSPNDRVIYFFGCPRCNQFKALRYSEHSIQMIQNGINRLWSHSENWSDNDYENNNKKFIVSDNDGQDKCVQKLNLDPLIIERKISNFKPFYIMVEEEKCLKECNNQKHSKFQIDISQIMDEKFSREEYEKSGKEFFQNDLISYKFYKHLSSIPRQIIRYSWKGFPLLNQSNLEINPSNCEKCGSKRVFEFQLMPALIYFLKPQDNQKVNFDFGTILVFVCSKNCTIEQINMEECIVLKDLDNTAIEKWMLSS